MSIDVDPGVAYSKLDLLFVDSAQLIPRHAAAGIYVGMEVVDMIRFGKLTVGQLADYPTSLTEGRIDTIASRIERAHGDAGVPPVANLRESGIPRGAGLLVANMIGTMYGLTSEHHLDFLARPGFTEAMLTELDETMQDHDISGIARALYVGTRYLLSNSEPHDFKEEYRQGMAQTAVTHAERLADPDLSDDVRVQITQDKEVALGALGAKLTTNIRGYVAPRLAEQAADYLRRHATGTAQLFVPATAETFAHNVATGQPDQAWF